MRAATDHSVVLVYTVAHALRIEKLLKQAHIACRLVPVPRLLSSDCGVCVRIATEDVHAAAELVAASGVEIQEIAQVP